MSRLGPVYTLAAGVVLTAALTVASANASPAIEQTTAASPVEATPAPAAEETPAPEESEPAEPEAKPADTTPRNVTYAGVVQGNGGLIAISIKNGVALAYFCDGHIESWLKGKAENNTILLEGKNALITAALGGGKAKGRVEFKGKSWRFEAPVAKKPGGLYRASAVVRGATISGGWIKLASGQSVGRLAFEGGGAAESAPAFDGGPVTWYGVELTPKPAEEFIDSWTPSEG